MRALAVVLVAMLHVGALGEVAPRSPVPDAVGVGASAEARVTSTPPSNSAGRSLITMHRVPMNGHCAVIARSNVWTKDQTDPEALSRDAKEQLEGLFWDYRIKVDPWQVFGHVEIEIVGEDIEVEHVWAANVIELEPLDDGREGVRIKVELDNQAQDDQQFDIDGTGVPSSAPIIVGCENLEPVESDCKLGVKYSMLNSFEGTLSSKVHVDTWQEGARISLDFGETEVEISESALRGIHACSHAHAECTQRCMPPCTCHAEWARRCMQPWACGAHACRRATLYIACTRLARALARASRTRSGVWQPWHR